MCTQLSALVFLFGIVAAALGSSPDVDTSNVDDNQADVDISTIIDSVINEDISPYADVKVPVDAEETDGSSPVIDERVSVDQVITSAINEVAKLKSFINSVSNRISGAAAGVIKGAYAAFDRAAAQRLQHAGSLGSHAAVCINRLKGTVNANADTRAKGVVGCVTSQVNSALNDVSTLLGVAQSAERDIGSARAALKACGNIKNVFKKVACVAKETAHVTGQAVSLAAKVQGAVADGVKIYNTFPDAVSNCEKNQLKGAEQDAASELLKLAIC